MFSSCFQLSNGLIALNEWLNEVIQSVNKQPGCPSSLHFLIQRKWPDYLREPRYKPNHTAPHHSSWFNPKQTNLPTASVSITVWKHPEIKQIKSTAWPRLEKIKKKNLNLCYKWERLSPQLIFWETEKFLEWLKTSKITYLEFLSIKKSLHALKW